MKARYQLAGTEATLGATMSVEAWEKLSDQLRASPNVNQWPTWEFLSVVDELVKTGKRNAARAREWKERSAAR